MPRKAAARPVPKPTGCYPAVSGAEGCPREEWYYRNSEGLWVRFRYIGDHGIMSILRRLIKLNLRGSKVWHVTWQVASERHLDIEELEGRNH